ncbi:hypothetical protein V8687_23620 (plasmid) [Shewanella baltica]|uniref:hypothetical protein n=1 Tax=Shewanella baltica TaxID=62322 RepID=UPI0030D1D931
MNHQFEIDITWCIEKISALFKFTPYWEQTFTVFFSQDTRTDQHYWEKVNHEAIIRFRALQSSCMFETPLIDYQAAYTEVTRLLLFSINVMTSNIIDTDDFPDMSAELEKIMTITHNGLATRAPSSIQAHDALLMQIQHCLQHFATATNSPLTQFYFRDDNMNKERAKAENI